MTLPKRLGILKPQRTGAPSESEAYGSEREKSHDDRKGCSSTPDRSAPSRCNICFFLLARSFDYPDVLRRPTSRDLARFRAGGSRLLLLWWAFALTAVVLVPLAVLFAAALVGANSVVVAVAAATGVCGRRRAVPGTGAVALPSALSRPR